MLFRYEFDYRYDLAGSYFDKVDSWFQITDINATRFITEVFYPLFLHLPLMSGRQQKQMDV